MGSRLQRRAQGVSHFSRASEHRESPINPEMRHIATANVSREGVAEQCSSYCLFLRLAAFFLSVIAVLLLTGHDRRIVWIEETPYRLVLDDVMITLRVAQNIATGNGPYFNPGEQVAANTSLFYPYMLSPLMDRDSPSAAIGRVQALSLLFTFASFCAVAFLPRNRSVAIAACVAMPVTSSVLTYASSGWEHVPQMLFATVGLILLWNADDDKLLTVCTYTLPIFGFAFLLRPDTLAMLMPLLLVSAYLGLRGQSLKLGFSIGLTVAIVLSYFVLHYKLYGDVVPNTYYLKVGALSSPLRDGVRYFFNTFQDGGNAAPIVAMFSVCVLSGLKTLRTGQRLALIACATFVCYIVYVGGDVFPGGRFLLAITPFATVAWMDSVKNAMGQGGRLATAVATIVGLCLTISIVRYSMLRVPEVVSAGSAPLSLPDDVEKQLSLISVIRERLEPSDGQIGLFHLGTLAYYLPEYQFADFLGKADPHIARMKPKAGRAGHNKWDFDFTLTRRSVVAVPLTTRDTVDEARAYFEKHPSNYYSDLGSSDALHENFEYFPPGSLSRAQTCGIYIRKGAVPSHEGE